MSFQFYSKNGQLLPTYEAAASLASVEYAYGFGVYETLRVMNGTIYFLDQHLDRLFSSAEIIGLEHPFSKDQIRQWAYNLVLQTSAPTFNLKILLVGAPEVKDATLSILGLNPLYTDKRMVREGVKLITHEYERLFPQAKTLNMLGSYLAYRQAKWSGAYDALLLDRLGCITEGTRTNFFLLKDDTIISAPKSKILTGVTKTILEIVISDLKLGYQEYDIRCSDFAKANAAFVTSTSSKVMPVRQIDEFRFQEIHPTLRKIVNEFDIFLKKSEGILRNDVHVL